MVEQVKKVNYKGRQFSISTKCTRQSGNWLVFLHGIGCAKECFDEAFNTELSARFSILTLDFIGFGGSDKPDDFSYTLDDHADITRLLIDQFDPQKTIIVGHSMGGAIGLLLSRNLKNLSNLISADGNLVSKDADIASRRVIARSRADFISKGFDAFVQDLKSADNQSFQKWAQWYGHSNKTAIYQTARSLVKWSDNGELLAYFNQLPKKAYIYGNETENHYLLNKLQRTTIFPITNSGHFMMLDNPRAFYSAISEYLNESDSLA